MKNLLFMLILFTCACNTVKKTTDKKIEKQSLQLELHKDSVSVSEDLVRLQHAYFKQLDKSVTVSFFPKTSTNKPVIIKDSNGTTVIDLGDNIPAAVQYSSNNSSAGKFDAAVTHKDSVADKSVQKKQEQKETTEVKKNKKSNRVPWYIIIPFAVFILLWWYSDKLFR